MTSSDEQDQLNQIISPEEQHHMWLTAHARLGLVQAVYHAHQHPTQGPNPLIHLAKQIAVTRGLTQQEITNTINNTWDEIKYGG